MEEKQFHKSISKGEEDSDNEYEELLASLPRMRIWNGNIIYKYHDFWLPSIVMQGTISFQKNFQAHDTDIILITPPKVGTTWLKALAFTIVNRSHFSPSDPQNHPLLTSTPHELVRFVEFDVYAKNECPNLDYFENPRIFATHLPFSLLPRSIIDSDCQIIYLCRNPLDQIVSLWHFIGNQIPETSERACLGDAVEMFCKGTSGFGPFWSHVLECWKESLEKPNKVLFLTYEDLKEDTVFHTKKLGEFLGFPFSGEEEREGVIEEILRLCSFENLKNLEVNKNGKLPWKVDNSAFFRKGEVGDWANYLTPEMADCIVKVMEEKFNGTGLTFKLSPSKSKIIP